MCTYESYNVDLTGTTKFKYETGPNDLRDKAYYYEHTSKISSPHRLKTYTFNQQLLVVYYGLLILYCFKVNNSNKKIADCSDIHNRFF